jgi:hypothetical protein
MASSWNKAVLVEADSAVDTAIASASRAVQEGKSLFQSVIDEAADKLAQGVEAIPDIEMPDIEVVSPELTEALQRRPRPTGIAEVNIPDPLGALQDAAQGAGEAIQDFGTSEFRFLFQNFFKAGTTLTESDLNSTDLDKLKDAVRNAQNEGRSSLSYPDFGTSEQEVLKGSPLTGLFDTDMRMARTIGGVQFSTNDKGETVITNTYNFNEGPKRKTFFEAKKSGDAETALKVLLDAAQNPVELASIIAYAKQEELREAGKPYETEMVINLGVL